MRRGFDVLKTVHIHDVVGRQVNPAGAQHALAPRPETLPGTMIHPAGQIEGAALEPRQDLYLIRRRLHRRSVCFRQCDWIE